MTRLGRPRSEQVEQAIIDATIALLAEHGYLGLSIEAIAAQAGVAKTTVYRRWPGKDELILAALSRLKGPLATPAGEDVRADLLYLLDHVRAQWTNGVHGRLMHQLSADGWDRPQQYREFRERLIAPRTRVMLDVLQRGIDEGLIHEGTDLRAVHEMLVSPILAAAFTHQELPSHDRLAFYLDTVLAGLRP